MSDSDWMRRLALHFEEMRRGHPADELLVMFDIDGTIVTSRSPRVPRARGCVNNYRGVLESADEARIEQ